MLAQHDCRNSYIETIKELKCSYQKTWTKMLSSISLLDDLPRIQSDGKIKDKDRGVLKERFLVIINISFFDNLTKLLLNIFYFDIDFQ